jgi:hypothetical protein
MTLRAITPVLALACAAIACTPVLDWRDVRPEGSGLAAQFPCKPASLARQLALAGVRVEMTLYACSASGVTYAVAFADIDQPQLVGRALGELARAAARNIGAQGPPALLPLRVDGATPNAFAGRQALAGQLGDGQRVEEQVAVFARGTRIYQATMVGPRLEIESVDAFFGALRLPT